MRHTLTAHRVLQAGVDNALRLCYTPCSHPSFYGFTRRSGVQWEIQYTFVISSARAGSGSVLAAPTPHPRAVLSARAMRAGAGLRGMS